jgi:serine/threonine protein kinase
MTLETVGRYKITAELGRGGMSTVYAGHDPISNRDVAIKILPRELLHDPMFRARFEREAQIIATLEHPAILPVYDYGEADGQPFFVMRLMTGGSLADRLSQGPIPLAEAARIISILAGALDQAHSRGIIHRDLKPGNILFDQHNDPFLADFGIAKLSEAGATLTGNVIVGTPAYMSPEQGRGEKDLDGRSDVYSLGVILFEMLTGRVPYLADTPMGQIIKHMSSPIPDVLTYQPGLPPNIQEVISRAMHKRKFGRFSSAGEMAQALQAVAAGKPIPALQAVQTFATLPGVEPLPSSEGTPPAEVKDLGKKGKIGAVSRKGTKPARTKKKRHWALRLLRTIALVLLSLVLLAALVGVGLPIVVNHEWPDSFYARIIYGMPVVPNAIVKSPTPKPTFTQTPTATITPLPTKPLLVTSKPTATLQNTPTQRPIPSATPISVYPVRGNSSYPTPQETLSASNVYRIQKIAVAGSGGFLDIAISQDASTLVVASTLGVNLYDLQTFELIGWLPSQNPVYHLEFSPDGNLLALAELDFITLWDWKTQTLVKRFPAQSADRIKFAAFSSSGQYIWGGSTSTYIWKTDDGSQVLWLDGISAQSVSISLDDKIVAAPTANTIRLILLSDGSLQQELRVFGVYQAKFLPDGDQLLGFSDNLVHVFSLSRGALTGSMGGAVPVLSQDGTTLATDNGAGKVQVWRLSGEGVPGFPVRQFDQIGYSYPEYRLPNYQLSQNGEYLAYWNTWSPSYIFQDLLEENRSWSGSFGSSGMNEPFNYSYYDSGGNFPLTKLVFSPLDAETVIALWQNRQIEIWDFTTSQAHQNIVYNSNFVSSQLISTRNLYQLPGGQQSITSPDQLLVARAESGKVLITKMGDGTLLHTILANAIQNTDLVFSPDSSTLATISLGPTIRLWRVEDGRQICVVNGDGASPDIEDAVKLYFSDDSRILAVLHKGPKVSYWDAQSCRRLETYLIQNTAVSPDGSFFVELQPFQVNLRKLNDGSLIRTLYGEFEQYSRNTLVGFSSDGKYLGATYVDGTTHLWGIIP